jgi:hypothetical protein
MAVSARVTSIDALVDFKAHLTRFGTDATNALAGLQQELRRVFEWLEGQLKDWQREVRRRQELVTRTKAELIQHEYGSDKTRGPGHTEKKIRLEKAVTALREAEAKVECCQHWTNHLPQEVIECEGPAHQLAGMLEADLRQGLGVLEQKILALESYVALTSAAVAAEPAGSAAPANPPEPAVAPTAPPNPG